MRTLIAEPPKDAARSQLSKAVALLWMGVVVFLTLSGAWGIMGRALLADDDNLWLSYSVDKLQARELGNRLENEVIEFARSEGATKQALARLEMRRDYDTNYGLALLAWSVVDRLVLSNVQDLNLRTALRLGVALVPIVLLPWLVVFWLLSRMRSRSLWLAILVVFSWLSIVAFSRTSYGNFITFGDHNLLWSIKNLLLFTVAPAPAFSLFGFTPRNLIAVLVLAAALSRWQGLDRACYALLALGVGVHTSLGFMTLCCFVASDSLFARHRLRDPVCLSILAAALAYSLWNERMLAIVSAISWRTPALAMLALAVTAALGMRLLKSGDPATVLAPLDRVSAWASANSAQPRVKQDVVLLAAAIGLFVIVGYVASFLASPFSVRYFWGQLPTRLYGAVGPAAIIGAVVLLQDRFNDHRQFEAVVATVVAVAVALAALSIGQYQQPADTVRRQLAEYEAALTRGGRLTSKQAIDERLIYYELGRSIRDGSDPVRRLRHLRP